MWLFKKRKNQDNSELFQQINSNLKESFTRIKKDIQATRDWLTFFKDREQDHEKRLQNIESRLEELDSILNYMQEAQEEIPKKQEVIIVDTQREERETEEDSEPTRILNDLTDTQKAIFLRLGTLLYESSQEWITAKALAQEIYPDKQYDKVRSTLSEYTSILIESGLVKKRRRGKLTYMSITEKGLQLFEKTKKTKLKKILSQGSKRD